MYTEANEHRGRSTNNDQDNAVRLLRQMNHDMRNPLNALLATATMLEDGIYDSLSAKQLRAVQRIERNGKRILALLDTFVIYMKADAGQYPLNLADFSPRELVEGVLAECQDAAQAKGLTITLTIGESMPQSLYGDKDLIQRIVRELAWNAISFSDKGRVELISTLEQAPDGAMAEDTWQITVKDTGPGIPASLAPHIYDPFWRGETTGSIVPTSGSGLGLTLARTLTILLGGDLNLKAPNVLGSEFVVRLPLRRGKEGKELNGNI